MYIINEQVNRLICTVTLILLFNKTEGYDKDCEIETPIKVGVKPHYVSTL